MFRCNFTILCYSNICTKLLALFNSKLIFYCRFPSRTLWFGQIWPPYSRGTPLRLRRSTKKKSLLTLFGLWFLGVPKSGKSTFWGQNSSFWDFLDPFLQLFWKLFIGDFWLNASKNGGREIEIGKYQLWKFRQYPHFPGNIFGGISEFQKSTSKNDSKTG